ncbi:MAG TPA: tetratricopeptide repeat protein [Gemmataceae bacterium]|nr:tetratricopeptide repeat protein [Gemmataceae bacterium]
MAVSPPPASGSTPPLGASAPSKSIRRKYAPLKLALPVMGLCLLVIGVVVYFVVYPQITAEYHWRQAKKAISNNDLTKAQEHLERCLQARPTDGEVLFTLARTQRRAGKVDEVVESLRKAGQQHWVPNQIKLEMMLLKAQMGILGQVSKQLQEILKEGHADDRFILEALIFGYLRTNFLSEANRWAMVWIEQHLDDWLARYWHGLVMEGASQFSQAKEEYEKALELNPDGFDLHLRVAEVLMHNNPSEDILSHYEAALKSDPKNPIALYGLARCQQSLRSSEMAKTTLDRVIEADPKFIKAYILEAQLADDEDKFEEAYNWLKKALEIDPNDRLANQKLFEALGRLNRKEEAREVQLRTKEIEKQLTRLDEINKELLDQPKDVALRNEAGNILLNLGKAKEAFSWFISAFFIDAKDKPTKEGMKKCLQRMGDREQADRYRQFLEDRSPNPAS